MLRGRLSLVSVYLCFVCVLALTLQRAPIPCSQDIINKVEFLIRKAPDLKWLDCRLYTPTVEDFQNCPSSTLTCFADEMKVLIEEWVAVGGIRKLKLNRDLEKLALLFNQMESECRQCELLEEKGAEQFLEGLRLTLTMMNSQHCSPTPASPKILSKKTS